MISYRKSRLCLLPFALTLRYASLQQPRNKRCLRS